MENYKKTKQTEVEIRAFLTKGQYLKLLKFFRKNGKKINEDFQETLYFDSKQDLRIQKNKKFSKIWLKSGKIHDDVREEIEIIVPRKDYQKLLDLFLTLGYKIDIKWLRKRNEFKWRGVSVCLDSTKGYGYIIELEKSITKKDHSLILQKLRTLLKELGIVETPKKEFDKKYNYYRKNWRKLLGDLK
jgi:predicted adenylyl cyclase CyaB